LGGGAVSGVGASSAAEAELPSWLLLLLLFGEITGTEREEFASFGVAEPLESSLSFFNLTPLALGRSSRSDDAVLAPEPRLRSSMGS
jgi:hypothetical protein